MENRRKPITQESRDRKRAQLTKRRKKIMRIRIATLAILIVSIVVGAVLLDVLKKKSAARVKIEKDYEKLANETKEKIEALKVEQDYALSAKDNAEAAARAAEIEKELAELKKVLKVDVPAMKAANK